MAAHMFERVGDKTRAECIRRILTIPKANIVPLFTSPAHHKLFNNNHFELFGAAQLSFWIMELLPVTTVCPARDLLPSGRLLPMLQHAKEDTRYGIRTLAACGFALRWGWAVATRAR